MIRKIIPLIMVLACIFSISAVPAVAVATEESQENLPQPPQGVDLGDFDVKLSCKNYTLYSSGMYMAIEIVFDKDFATANFSTENDADTDFLTSFTPPIQSLGYVVSVKKDKYTVLGERKFDDIAQFYIVTGRDGYEISKSDYVKQESFFFTDTFIKQSSPFSGIEDQEQGVFKDILQLFYDAGIKREAILLNYVYGTPYAIIKSDAEHTSFSATQNIYLHSYEMNMDMSDKNLNLVQRSPNTVGWYLLAIMLSVVVISVPAVIFMVKHHKKKEKTYE